MSVPKSRDNTETLQQVRKNLKLLTETILNSAEVPPGSLALIFQSLASIEEALGAGDAT